MTTISVVLASSSSVSGNTLRASMAGRVTSSISDGSSSRIAGHWRWAIAANLV